MERERAGEKEEGTSATESGAVLSQGLCCGTQAVCKVAHLDNWLSLSCCLLHQRHVACDDVLQEATKMVETADWVSASKQTDLE